MFKQRSLFRFSELDGGFRLVEGARQQAARAGDRSQEAENANRKWALTMNYLRPSLGDRLQQVCTSFSFPEQENQQGPGVQMSGQLGTFLFQIATFTPLNFPGLVLHPHSPCFVSLQSEFTAALLSSLFTPSYSGSSHALSSSPSYLSSAVFWTQEAPAKLSCYFTSLCWLDWESGLVIPHALEN